MTINARTLGAVLFLAATALSGQSTEAAFLKNSESLAPDLSKLPRKFDGHNLSALLTGLLKLEKDQRGEFERTEEYKARHAKQTNETLGSVMDRGVAVVVRNSPFAKGDVVVYGKDVATPLSVKYSPDQEEFVIAIPLGKAGCSQSSPNDYIETKHLDRKVREYVGSNAYGVTANVTESSTVHEGVSLNMMRFQGDALYVPGERFTRPALSFRVAMPHQRARALKQGQLAVLLFGMPRAPQAYSCNHQSSATIDSPYVQSIEFRWIELDVRRAWIFDYETGEILKRVSFDREAS